MADQESAPSLSAPGVIDRLAAVIAAMGGLLCLGIAGIVSASVLGRNLGDEGVPGDFEYVQMGTAIAVFAFLPLCQLRRGNIIVDTFSSGWPPRLRAGVDALWDLAFATISGLLAYALFLGTFDQRASGSATMVMNIPIWPAILACAVLCAFLSLVCLVTAWRRVRRPA